MLKLRREDVSPDHFQVYSGQVRIGTIYKTSGTPEGRRDTSGGCKLHLASEEPCQPQKYGECGSPLTCRPISREPGPLIDSHDGDQDGQRQNKDTQHFGKSSPGCPVEVTCSRFCRS